MKMYFSLTMSFVSLVVFLMGCGVRGRPQAPLEPAHLGTGQPTFKRSTEEYVFPDNPTPEPTPEAKKSKSRDGRQ